MLPQKMLHASLTKNSKIPAGKLKIKLKKKTVKIIGNANNDLNFKTDRPEQLITTYFLLYGFNGNWLVNNWQTGMEKEEKIEQFKVSAAKISCANNWFTITCECFRQHLSPSSEGKKYILLTIQNIN